MSTWILLAVLAQAIAAVVAVVDKYIVSGDKSLMRPFVYAFYTCLISGAWIVVYLFGLFPLEFFGFSVPSFANVNSPSLVVSALSLVAAYTFFIGLVSLFQALRKGEASDVVPVVGAVSAITTFGLGYVFLNDRLTLGFIAGIVLLALGTALVSRYRFGWRTALTTIHAGIFFAIHYIAIKAVFNITSFDDGFFWSRIAFVLVALSMLLVPRYFEKITTQTKEAGSKGGVLVFFNKLLAGISTILILKATELGEVSVVQALGGLQFVFILLIVMVFDRLLPDECAEHTKYKPDVYRKIFFIFIITLGFFMLFV